MGLFNRLLGIPEIVTEEMSDEDKFVNQIANDINFEFEKWIKPQLAKAIGEDKMEKLADADFEAVLATQSLRLFIKRGVTIKSKTNAAVFNFKLCQGEPEGQHKVLSKFKYEFKLEDQEEAGL